jgi:predicted nucleic acid-binding protein
VGEELITLDTSGLFALLNRRDPDHERTREALLEDSGPYLVPAGILAEVAYLVERRLGVGVLERFVLDLESGALTLECGEEDLPRIRELALRYADLPLGFADASVISCAERSGGGVLTLDRRDFDVVAGEGKITPLP